MAATLSLPAPITTWMSSAGRGGGKADSSKRVVLPASAVLMTTLRSRTPRDLAVICGKCLEKDRDRRYPTMAALAADLDRFLADEPILARRHCAAIVGYGAVIAATVLGAFAAAFRDPRFPPLEPSELDLLAIEISVLTRPQPVSFDSEEELLSLIEPGLDGLKG